MLRSIIVSAFGAGIVVGVLLTAVQFVTTEPLILHAEQFESAEPAENAAPAHEHEAAPAEAHAHDEDEWSPADGFERSAYTFVANLLMGVAASALLLGVMTLRGGPIDARTGILWGIGGFFAAALLPSLGLSPELPGTPAAEVVARQVWWLGAVAASAAGIALVVFGKAWFWKAGGIVLALIPHLVGAPRPPSLEASYPAVLGGEFVVASLVVSALLWSLSGLVSAWLYQRLASRA